MRGRGGPGALSFKLGPGSHYLPNQHSHNVKQQTNSGLLRTLNARKRERAGGGRGDERDVSGGLRCSHEVFSNTGKKNYVGKITWLSKKKFSAPRFDMDLNTAILVQCTRVDTERCHVTLG